MITELEPGIELTLRLFQHVCGAVTLPFSCLILLLIIADGDSRNKDYRKYLCCLQITAMLIDTNSDAYAPIALFNKGLLYSDSYLSQFICQWHFFIVEMLMVAHVPVAYFACVYYRRGPLLPPEFEWVRNRTTHMYMSPDANAIYAHCVFFSVAITLLSAIIAMLAQVTTEVKKGTTAFWSPVKSPDKGYQQLAVRSLIIQGAVPTIVFAIPIFGNAYLQFASSFFVVGEDFERNATVISPILFIIITRHSLVNSLTILYCSPSYRRKIVAFVSNSRESVPARIRDSTAH